MREDFVKMDSSEIKSEYLCKQYNEIANSLGIDATLKLYEEFRGQRLDLPVNLFSREYIASQIVKEYENGYSAKQLATKFGYSEKWIRKILKDHIDNI